VSESNSSPSSQVGVGSGVGSGGKTTGTQVFVS